MSSTTFVNHVPPIVQVQTIPVGTWFVLVSKPASVCKMTTPNNGASSEFEEYSATKAGALTQTAGAQLATIIADPASVEDDKKITF